MSRQHFSVWGPRASELNIAAYAIRQDYEFPIEAVMRSIERSTGLTVCAGPRDCGCSRDARGAESSHHYQIALGRPLRHGGHSVEAEIWISVVPVGIR